MRTRWIGRPASRIAIALVTLIAGSSLSQADPIIYGSAFGGRLSTAASLYTINPNTGVGTLIGPIGFDRVGSLAFNPQNGTLYGVGNDPTTGAAELITINTTTGAGTLVGSLALGSSPVQDISFRHSDAGLFAYRSGNIYTINTTTGKATLVGITGSFPDGNGISFSAADTLYLANDLGLFTVNQSNGSVTLVENLNYPSPPFTPSGDPRENGLDFDPGTGTLYASLLNGFVTSPPRTNYLGTIDIPTGNVNLIGPTVPGLDGLAISPSAAPSTPEPGSLVLLGVGGSVLLFAGWRRRRSRV